MPDPITIETTAERVAGLVAMLDNMAVSVPAYAMIVPFGRDVMTSALEQLGIDRDALLALGDDDQVSLATVRALDEKGASQVLVLSDTERTGLFAAALTATIMSGIVSGELEPDDYNLEQAQPFMDDLERAAAAYRNATALDFDPRD